MSTRLPIAQKIMNGAIAKTAHGEDNRGASVFGPALPRHALNLASKFDIHLAADLTKQGHGFRQGAEVLRPPFPNLWMEWSMPHNLRGEVCELDTACLIVDNSPNSSNPLMDLLDDDLPTGWNMIFYLSRPDSSGYLSLGAGTTVTLDDEGRFDNWMHLFSVGTTEPEATVKWIEHAAIVPMVALSLINCKNVQTEESGRVSVKRGGNAKRRKAKPFTIRYNTIILPGGGSEWTGGSSGTHRASSVHKVRGHFKTFTADAPLLGKHVGTYWWGWQIRGSAEKGIVVSDYELKRSSR